MGETLFLILAFAVIINTQRKIMGALKNLQDAVAVLDTNTAAVVEALKNKGVPEADVQAQADAVNVDNAKLAAALNPPVV
jgi:hypothetical protein